MAIYFSTINGKLTGRSSHAYLKEENAKLVCDFQNERAKALGIKVRYEVGQCDQDDLPVNETPR